MKTEYKIIVESAGHRTGEQFWCYATGSDDAIKQAHAFRPHAWVRSIECTGRREPTEDRLHPMFAAILQPMKGGAM
jgi:hypothetical protein